MAEEKLDIIKNEMEFLTTVLNPTAEMENNPEIMNDMNGIQNNLRGSSDTVNNDPIETKKYLEIRKNIQVNNNPVETE